MGSGLVWHAWFGQEVGFVVLSGLGRAGDWAFVGLGWVGAGAAGVWSVSLATRLT